MRILILNKNIFDAWMLEQLIGLFTVEYFFKMGISAFLEGETYIPEHL